MSKEVISHHVDQAKHDSALDLPLARRKFLEAAMREDSTEGWKRYLDLILQTLPNYREVPKADPYANLPMLSYQIHPSLLPGYQGPRVPDAAVVIDMLPAPEPQSASPLEPAGPSESDSRKPLTPDELSALLGFSPKRVD